MFSTGKRARHKQSQRNVILAVPLRDATKMFRKRNNAINCTRKSMAKTTTADKLSAFIEHEVKSTPHIFGIT